MFGENVERAERVWTLVDVNETGRGIEWKQIGVSGIAIADINDIQIYVSNKNNEPLDFQPARAEVFIRNRPTITRLLQPGSHHKKIQPSQRTTVPSHLSVARLIPKIKSLAARTLIHQPRCLTTPVQGILPKRDLRPPGSTV